MIEQSDRISWIPHWLESDALQSLEVKTQSPPDLEQSWFCQRPRPDQWAAVSDGMRSVGSQLKALPIRKIVTAIDRVAARWCDPRWSVRVAARQRVIDATAFSAESVDHSFDLELRNYRADPLWRTLQREFGDPLVLDQPTYNNDLDGLSMALGPELVLAIFTGNVPGLPALSLIRSLLVKAPVIAKVASGEPTFAATFAETLYDELPLLGDALLISYWDRDEREVLIEVARQCDCIIAYGGIAAMSTLKKEIPAEAKLIEHGHKLSVGYLSDAYCRQQGRDQVAERVANDVVTFNQLACIAPQAYFVEGDADTVRQLAESIGRALANAANERPIGSLHTLDAARIQLVRADYAWRSAIDSRYDLWHARDLEWTVLLDDALNSVDGIGYRLIRLIPVTGLASMIGQLRPFKRYLQNIGLGVSEAQFVAATTTLAELGASRICQPGMMAEPSMMWRHDGQPCLAAMTRWCDIEMHHCLNKEV